MHKLKKINSEQLIDQVTSNEAITTRTRAKNRGDKEALLGVIYRYREFVL